MKHFANFSSSNLSLDKGKSEYHSFQGSSSQYSHQSKHFANFVLSPEQQRTADSLNYLRKNDPEEFNRIKSAGQDVRKRNQNVNLPIVRKKVDSGENAAELYAKNRQDYNKRFVQSTNANQASTRLGKIGNTIKRYGKAAAGLGGAALTASYVLPSIMSLMPQKTQEEQDS